MLKVEKFLQHTEFLSDIIYDQLIELGAMKIVPRSDSVVCLYALATLISGNNIQSNQICKNINLLQPEALSKLYVGQTVHLLLCTYTAAHIN